MHDHIDYLPDAATTAAFTGNREYAGQCESQLRLAIRRLYGAGWRTFMSGMAIGFDLAAAEAVIELRSELEGLRLVCVVPFAGQQLHYSDAERRRYERVAAQADRTIILAPRYEEWVYRQRNDFLVDNASAIVAYHNGRKGGTGYTMAQARRRGVPVVNLCACAQQKLDL